MGANRQTFLCAFPTTAAVLRSVGRWHGYNSTASIYCFAFEDGPELRPAGITVMRVARRGCRTMLLTCKSSRESPSCW